jgi:hypothetical protein
MSDKFDLAAELEPIMVDIELALNHPLYAGDARTIVLDGRFTIEELEGIIAYMRARNEQKA